MAWTLIAPLFGYRSGFRGRATGQGRDTVYRVFNERLNRLVGGGHARALQGGRKGIEKESLRVGPDGGIARTPHPEKLGAALTHPHITTDYSEALLEFVTDPYPDVHDALRFLADVHRYVYEAIGDELLWATSMPCVVAGDEGIPIARYGTSNSGRMKSVYRRGLKHRYGGLMQVIAGVHFNYSLPEEFWPRYGAVLGWTGDLREHVDGAYFSLIRNLLRFSWIVPYLFGSSPAVCRTFLAGREGRFSRFNPTTLFEPYATSLRMSDIGYSNKSPKGLDIRYDDLARYVESLTYAIETPYPPYERLGVRRGGEYLQLNPNILQIENEYYSPVRPKRPPQRGERPTVALQRHGVQYVELRSLDVDPFSPIGVSAAELRFLEAFLVFCLLHESPPIDRDEGREIEDNVGSVARRGREPGLILRRRGRGIALGIWAAELIDGVEAVCEVLDHGRSRPAYGDALAAQRDRLRDPDRLPSARMLDEMRERGEGFLDFALRLSERYRADFEARPLDEVTRRAFEALARESIDRQAELEARDELSFEQYLERYFAERIV